LTPDTLTSAYSLRFGVVRRHRAESEHACKTERSGPARHLSGDTPQMIDGLRIHIKPLWVS
jgi:hypothetical protein